MSEEKKEISNHQIGIQDQNPVDAEGRNRPVLIQQLTVRPLVRKEQDIATMLQAIRSAESAVPRRTDLYHLYEDFLTTDGHLRSVYDKFLAGVTNIAWQYTDKNGQEVPFMKDWIDSPDFELLIEEIGGSKAWGYSMTELDFYGDKDFGVFAIPKRHMRPHRGIIAFEQTGDHGINIREGIYADTIIEAGGEKDLGLLMVAAQYVIFKRGSLSDWAQFAEVFGQPLVDAVWDGFDENQRRLLLEAIDTMGSGGKLVRPAGTQIQLLQGGTNNPNGELYKGIVDVCNAEISKLFLGQTETTESSESSGYAQASVHADTEDDVKRKLRNFVRRILNRRVLKSLEKFGVVEPGGVFGIKGDGEENLSRAQQLEMEVKLKTVIGLPISDDHFYENYGIEKPADYEAQKAALEAQRAAQSTSFNMSMGDLIKLRDQGFFV